VDERQGDRPEGLLRTQQSWERHHRSGWRFGTGWGEHGPGERAGFQAKGAAGG
jgi:hypothetical protein